MGTEVLRPQDVFYDRYRLSPPAFHHRRKTYFANGNGFGNPRPNNNSGHKKPVPRLERSDHKRKTSHQSPPPQKSDQQPQLQIPRRSSSVSPPPQPQKSERRIRSSSEPPPPQPPKSVVVEQQQLQLNHLLLPRRSASVDELQNDLPRVTILRRGQSLDTIDATRLHRDLYNETTGGGGGGLVRDDVYAGSAFFVSPSPSSLPLPSFFNINNSNGNNNSMNISNHITIINNEEFHDSATRDLRRLLRLEWADDDYQLRITTTWYYYYYYGIVWFALVSFFLDLSFSISYFLSNMEKFYRSENRGTGRNRSASELDVGF